MTSDPLAGRARGTPNRIALEWNGGSWSYAELDEAANRVAALLRPLLPDPRTGAGPARRLPPQQIHDSHPSHFHPDPPVVAAFLPPTAEAVAAIHGIPRSGAALAPLHADWTVPELEAVIERLAPEVVVIPQRAETAGERWADDPRAMIGASGTGIDTLELPPLVRTGSTGGTSSPPERTGGTIPPAEGASGTSSPAERAGGTTSSWAHPSLLHTIVATSGSTGRPRLVRLTAANHLASARGSIERLGLGPGDRWLATLSFAHIGGLAMAVRAPVAGSTLVLGGHFDAARTAELLERAEITHASLVPTMLRRLLDFWGERPVPATLSVVLVGGAALEPALLDRALSRGWPTALTYGLTEAASQLATADPERVRRKPGTVGPPLSGTEIRIEDGEILARGPTITPGYWDEPAGNLEDGWLQTADLGYLDRDGDLWIVGRRASRIVTGGVTVDPAEIEAVLRSHVGVREAVVVGLPDPEWGERVVAAVVPNDPDGPTSKLLAQLTTLCQERLAGPKRPKAYGRLEQLPQTATGKPDRAAIRRRLATLLD